MKFNIKNQSFRQYLCLIIIGYLSVASLALNAGLANSNWHKEFGPGFEVLNKSKNELFLTVKQSAKESQDFIVAPNSKKSIEISPSTSLFIEIKTELNGKFQTHLYYIDIKQKNKTKYLTWNPAKFNTPDKYLYPQTGPYAGWTGKSESGYKLGNNVAQADIEYVRPKR